MSCEYHRDHQIHSPPPEPEPPQRIEHESENRGTDAGQDVQADVQSVRPAISGEALRDRPHRDQGGTYDSGTVEQAKAKALEIISEWGNESEALDELIAAVRAEAAPVGYPDPSCEHCQRTSRAYGSPVSCFSHVRPPASLSQDDEPTTDQASIAPGENTANSVVSETLRARILRAGLDADRSGPKHTSIERSYVAAAREALIALDEIYEAQGLDEINACRFEIRQLLADLGGS